MGSQTAPVQAAEDGAPGRSPDALPLRALRAGFVLVVVMLLAATGFLSWSNARTSGHVDELVVASLERERLIGVIRLDVALLAQAAEAHINADSEDERKSADDAMAVILRELTEAIDSGTRAPLRGEARTWLELKETADRLVKKVAVTVKYSNRREAQRARTHLEEEVRPISFGLDDLASRLARENSDDTRLLVQRLQAIRRNTVWVGAVVIAVAVLVSVLVAAQVQRILKRQQRIILAQLEALSGRNRELDAFASRVAHDLLAPLSPLKGYLTLARRASGDAGVRELLTQAESSTARMTELVDGLLRYCRAGVGGERQVGRFDAAVASVLLEQSQAAEALGVRLERDLAEGVAVACPSALLQSIALNLVTNAVKYSAASKGARVAVRLYVDGDAAVLEVEDNGPGLGEAAQERLFEPFFRAPEVRHLPGHGLGLATTRRLVEGHGGVIEVRSAAGAGVTAVVRLPLAGRA